MLDKTPADSGSRERALGWLFEELQLDEVMVFVAKLVTFLVVCGICSVTTVAVGLRPSGGKTTVASKDKVTNLYTEQKVTAFQLVITTHTPTHTHTRRMSYYMYLI